MSRKNPGEHDRKKKLLRFDALSIYQKYTDIFDIDDIPEEERKETARTVANRVLIELSQGSGHEATSAVSTACEVNPKNNFANKLGQSLKCI